MRKAVIKSVGSYLPSRVVSNHDLEKTLDTNDEWIRKRSGIVERHIAGDGELTSDLATAAARRALESAKMAIDAIDLIIIATTTPDLTFPSCAALTQEKLGGGQGIAFDVQAVCSGFAYGLSVGGALIETGQAQNALIIGAETMSRIIDWQDRTTAVLFGDGAGAVILSGMDDVKAHESHLIGSRLRCDGNLSKILYVDGGVSSTGTAGKLRMEGKEVFRQSLVNMPGVVCELLAQSDYGIDDVDWFIPHQANQRIIDGVAHKLKLPPEKIISTVAGHANTSAASIPLALDSGVRDGRIKQGDLIACVAMGGGLTWGANLLRW